jgi:hypothetical protein
MVSADLLVPALSQIQNQAGVEAVTIPVSILGSDGLPVARITSEELVVIDDGVVQVAATLMSPDNSPLDVAMLAYLSEGMAPFAEEAKVGALSVLDQLSDADCVLYQPLGGQHDRGAWGNPNDPALRTRIRDSSLDGGSAQYVSVVKALNDLASRPNRCEGGQVLAGPATRSLLRRPVLVLLTDGFEEISVASFAHALSAARLGSIPILTIPVGPVSFPEAALREMVRDESLNWGVVGGTPAEREAWLTARSQLRQLAVATGGALIGEGGLPDKLRAAFEDLVRWLGSYHVVVYYPEPPAPRSMDRELPVWHEVEIHAPHGGYRIHAPPGYYRNLIDTAAARSRLAAGTELLGRGEVKGALAEFGLSVDADPYDWESHYQLGRTLAITGDARRAQQALLEAAALNPGQGDVHKLACLVSLELEDDETAWEQAIRAHQAGMNMTEELRLLRAEAAEPINLDLRLHAPRIVFRTVLPSDPRERAVLRRMSRTLATVLAEVPEFGLIDLEALAQYELTIVPRELALTMPLALEAVMTLTNAIGMEVLRQDLSFSDLGEQEMVAAEFAPHVDEIRAILSDRGQEAR